MNTKHLLIYVLLSVSGTAIGEIQTDTLKRIELLAHADDLHDQKLMAEKDRLIAESDLIYPSLSKIIQSSSDDSVLNVTFAITETAKSKRSELNNLAVDFLNTRNPENYTLSIQRALAIVGSSKDHKNSTLLSRFLSNPEILVRTAAQDALLELNASSDASLTSLSLPAPRPVSVSVSQGNAAAINAPRPNEESIQHVWWVICLASIGLLWLVFKKRK